MRVAFLESTGEMGGAEHVLLALLEGFSRDEVQSYLVCPKEGELTARAARAHIRTIILPIPTFASVSVLWGNHKVVNPFAVIYDVALIVLAAIRTARRLRREQVEIIHTNTFFAHLYGGIAASLLGVPCVWHVHDLVDTRRFGGLVAWLWRQLGDALATHIVGCSKAVIENFANLNKRSTIYVGIEAKPDAAKDWEGWHTKLKLAPRTVLVGYLGRIVWLKGLDLLARAAKQVVAKDDSIHFVVIGKPLFGESGYADRVEAQIRKAGLTEHWHVIGYVPDAYQYLGDLDLIVVPSRREPFGRVALEAGLASKAVVAAAVGGIPEIIEPSVSGILVPVDAHGNINVVALSDAIVSLANDAKQRKFLGSELNKRVLTEFGLEPSISRFIGLYRSILNVASPAVRAQSPQNVC